MKISGPRLWLVRHGQTDWNVAGRVQGHTPTSLNAAGRQEALNLAQWLALRGTEASAGSISTSFKAIWSSDLPRAFETATAIAQRLQLPVEQTPLLRERTFGPYEGATTEQIREARTALGLPQNNDLANWTGMPGVESNDILWQRINSKLLEIAAQHVPGDDVIVVTHGGVIARAIYHVLGIPDDAVRRFSLANGIALILEARTDGYYLLSLVDLGLVHGRPPAPDTAIAPSG